VKPGEVARSLSRGAFFLGSEKIVTSFSTILYSALIARWLGPTKYGVFALAFSAVSLATAFTGNFENYLDRYAAEHHLFGQLGTLRRAFAIAFGLKFVLGLVAGAVLVLIAPWLAVRYRIPELGFLLPLLSAVIVADSLSSTGRSLLFGLQRFGWVSTLSLVASLGRTALVWALWTAQQGLRSLAIGMSLLSLAQALLFGLAAVVVLARLRPPPAHRAADDVPPTGGLLRQMTAYCTPMLGANLSFLSGQSLGKLVLGLVIDPRQLGYFNFAFTTVERFVEIVNTLPRALLPSLTRIVAVGDRERLHYVFNQAFRLMQVAAGILSFGLFVYAREIVLLIGSPLFEPAIPLLRVLALVPIVRTTQQPFTVLFQALRKPGNVLLAALAKLVAEGAGYLVLVMLTLGVSWACWSNLFGAAASFTCALLLARRLLPEGERERFSVFRRALLVLVPSALVTLVAERWMGGTLSLAVRLPLVVPALLAVLALGLITRYDLEKLAALPLGSPLASRVRDRAVALADRAIVRFGRQGAA
jgi:O-antigen/teichoic acid export membrane protein